jgi:hypothetical protein
MVDVSTSKANDLCAPTGPLTNSGARTSCPLWPFSPGRRFDSERCLLPVRPSKADKMSARQWKVWTTLSMALALRSAILILGSRVGQTSWSAGCGGLWPRAESETPPTGRSETCPTSRQNENCCAPMPPRALAAWWTHKLRPYSNCNLLHGLLTARDIWHNTCLRATRARPKKGKIIVDGNGQ